MIELSQTIQSQHENLAKPVLSFIGGNLEDYNEFAQILESEFEINIMPTSDDLINHAEQIQPKVVMLINESSEASILEDISRLKSTLPECPVIIFTNQINPYMWHELIKAGVRYIFQRPTSIVKISDLCKRLCDLESAVPLAGNSVSFLVEETHHYGLKWKTELGETITNLISNLRDKTKSFMIESPSGALPKNTISSVAQAADETDSDTNQLHYVTDLDLATNPQKIDSLPKNHPGRTDSPTRIIVGSEKSMDTLFKKEIISDETYHSLCMNSIKFPALSECAEDLPTLVRWWSLTTQQNSSYNTIRMSKCASEWLIDSAAQHDWNFVFTLIEEATKEAIKQKSEISKEDLLVVKRKLIFGDSINNIEVFPLYFEKMTSDYQKALTLLKKENLIRYA